MPDALADFVGRAIERAKAHWRAAAELRRLGGDERRRIARDCALSEPELRLLAGQGKDAADLLTRRMRALALDPGSIGYRQMCDLRRCCAQCPSKRRCARELGDTGAGWLAWSAYCPNAYTLTALAAE
ncbi:MAG: hypothetical protein IT536_07535 [Hyphomicrobiales bacterium]|nr:hypothetical protein [Hyphomicrobiales bacterium]